MRERKASMSNNNHLRNRECARRVLRKARRGAMTVTVGAVLPVLFASPSVASVSSRGTHSAGSHSNFAGKALVVSAGPPTTPGQTKYWNELAAAFHKATGATIKYDFNNTSIPVELQIIDSAAVTHQGPDVVMLGDTVNATAYASHAFRPLSKADWASLGGTGQFWPGNLADSGPSPSQYTLVPMFDNPYLMAYNPTLFKKEGITGPPKTWTQFIQDAQKLTNPSAGIYGTAIDPSDTTDPWKTMWYLVHDEGAHFFSHNRQTALLSDPAIQKAFEFWFDFYTKYHIVPPQSLTWTSTDAASAFASGKIGMEIMSNASLVTTYYSGKIGHNFVLTPMPTAPYGSKSAPSDLPEAFLAYEGFSVTKYASMPLALQFLRLVDNPKYQLLMYKLMGDLPVNKVAGAEAAKLDPTVVKPEIAAQVKAQPTTFTKAWGTFEASWASVATDAASYVATHKGQLPASEVRSLLVRANSTVQAAI